MAKKGIDRAAWSEAATQVGLPATGFHETKGKTLEECPADCVGLRRCFTGPTAEANANGGQFPAPGAPNCRVTQH